MEQYDFYNQLVRAIDCLHTAYTLGVFLIDVLFHCSIVGTNNKHKSYKKIKFTFSSTQILLQYTEDQNLTTMVSFEF